MAKPKVKEIKKPQQRQERLDKNYASDEDFATELGNRLLDMWKLCKTQRQVRELMWQQSYRQWTVDQTHTDNQYTGMADLHIPQLRKEVETMSRRIYKGLLPEDYLKAEPEGGLGDDDLATVNTQVVRHYLDNVIQCKKALYPWAKQLVLFGTSPLRSYWHKEENELFYKKREAYADDQGIIRFKAVPVREKLIKYNAPKLRAEDIFNTWVYPHNAQSPDDIEVCFWRTWVKKFELKDKADKGMCYGFDNLQSAGTDQAQQYSESVQRTMQFGDSGTIMSLQGNDLFQLVEIWCDLKLPGEQTLTPCVVEIVGEKFVTRIQRNPYWHQEIPIDFGRFIIPPPGEFYGRGIPEAVINLQIQLDDTMNQTMDSATLALSPITIINPAYAPNSESFEVEPGAQWWADPSAVKQFQFPDLTEAGYKAAGTIKGWITELSDNSPQLPDPIAGKARSTGQAQLAVNEWQTDLFCFIDFISVEALNPMAYKIHSLIQQYISDDDVIKVSGRYAETWINRIVTPQDIVGRYKFKWTGALQIENQAIKTQQMLNFLNTYKQLPPEAQAKIQINWENLMIKLFRDGFLIKDVENLITTARMTESVSPYLEERILGFGGEIHTVDSDDDDAHIKFHTMAQNQDKDPITRAKRNKHINDHQNQKLQKQAAEQQAAQQQQMQQQQLTQGQPPGPNGPGPGGPGNKTQIPQSTSQSNLEKGIRTGV